MVRVRETFVMLAVAVLLSGPGFARGPSDEAAGVLRYLEPNYFADKGAPAWVIAELKARGCRIPQASYFDPAPHNIIRGEFVAPGQLDWAALCSRNKQSSIMLISKHSRGCSSEVNLADDSIYVQQVAAHQHGFSRIISAATKEDVVRYIKREGSKSPLSPGQIDHAGIVDQFMDKASLVLYCHGGRWLELKGAD